MDEHGDICQSQGAHFTSIPWFSAIFPYKLMPGNKKHDVVFGVELSPKSRYDNQEAHCGYTTVPRHQQWSLATYTGGKELPSRKLKIARRFFNFLCKGNDQVPKLEVITDDIRGLCNPLCHRHWNWPWVTWKTNWNWLPGQERWSIGGWISLSWTMFFI